MAGKLLGNDYMWAHRMIRWLESAADIQAKTAIAVECGADLVLMRAFERMDTDELKDLATRYHGDWYWRDGKPIPREMPGEYFEDWLEQWQENQGS